MLGVGSLSGGKQETHSKDENLMFFLVFLDPMLQHFKWIPPQDCCVECVSEDVCTLTDCECSRDRKGGGGKEVKRGRDRKEGIGIDRVAERNPHRNRERMNGSSRKENVQIGSFAERARYFFFTQQ